MSEDNNWGDAPLTQTPDGRWVPAQPVPFFKDGRTLAQRIGHALQVAWAYLYGRDGDDLLDELQEPYWIPVEPPYDRD